MNAFLIFLLEPPQNPPLRLAPIEGANLNEFDFIEHFYKRPNQTHTWNEYNLRPALIERLLSASDRGLAVR
jgi:hypothetical protein